MIRVDCRHCKERKKPEKNREGGRNHGIDRKR